MSILVNRENTNKLYDYIFIAMIIILPIETRCNMHVVLTHTVLCPVPEKYNPVFVS